jgi:hypothetical protein
MDVVATETNEVDKQEYQGKSEVNGSLLGKVKAQAKKDRYRYPTQVKYSGPKVHERTIVYIEVFVRREYTAGGADAEE